MIAADTRDLIGRAADLAADFATRAAEHDRDGSFPFENFERLRDAGLLNLTVPREYGGDDLGLTATCRVVEQIAKGDASTALVLAMHSIYHAVFGRSRRIPGPLHERICRESVEGIALINVLRVEPELGTPARGGLPATSARRTASGWALTGHKIYATGSPGLAYHFVWGRTAADGDAEDTLVGYFLVPARSPGLRIVETWDQMGMRATGSHDLIIEDVHLPAEHALDLRPPGQVAPDPALMGWNTLVLMSLYQGIACAARDWLLGYLHQRTPANLGASLATLPRFQSAVGEIEALLYTNDRLIYTLTAEIDAGIPGAGGHAGVVKLTVTTNAIRAVDLAMSLIGNPGLSRANPLERHHRDVLCSRIHTPQDDMIMLATGKAALERVHSSEFTVQS